MTKYFLIISLTALTFRLFFKRLHWLLSKRAHCDYLFMISISACRLTFIIGLYVLSLAFLVGITMSICRTSYGVVNQICHIEHVMEYTLCFGLFIIMSSCCVPYFFIKQIEVTDDGAAIDGIDVSWSLKKLGRQKESACYIQVHTNAKKGLYLLVNAQQLSQMLRKEITLGSQGLIPSARREKYLIDILNVRKKDSILNFLSCGLITAIVVAICVVSSDFIIS
ncbi:MULTISPECIES: hypothetical protein [unclassified Pseudocitrobacter]|uniref:hypothetical protein n=1 Tax=unclassified Pseudocitrobacter TaxID=2638778 RepID=UPI0023E444D7|nr:MULTISPECIES: hypothetical protein [unclassified Pseudocitrobacter]MDF3829603.1 hypothetical protein [Pseudocitrobacter sp. 2023EL-00150]MEC5376215.1 hypothetical protein [Pseudocitrobacter sp. MW920760]